MPKTWRLTPLGEVVTHRKEFIEIDDLRTYKRCRVQLYVKGVVLRDEIEGALIKTKQQQVCRANELLVAEIDAKVGGFGIVPPELEGAIVSSHYFLFVINGARLDPRFLGYYIKTPFFQEQVSAQGTTNYAAIRPQHVLVYTIPLPPLQDQRRIVVKIKQLEAKIEEARGLHTTRDEEIERLAVAMAHRSDLSEETKMEKGWKKVRLGEVITLKLDLVEVDTTVVYPNLGILSFGRGLFHKPPIEGALTSAKILCRVKPGQFIYSRLFAFEGAYGMVTDEFSGHYVSGEFPTFDCNPNRVLAEFLWAYFRSPRVWIELASGSKGLGHRRQRVHPERILEYKCLLPPIEWQQKIAKMQAYSNRLKTLQAQTAAELEALLPSILDKAFKGEL